MATKLGDTCSRCGLYIGHDGHSLDVEVNGWPFARDRFCIRCLDLIKDAIRAAFVAVGGGGR